MRWFSLQKHKPLAALLAAGFLLLCIIVYFYALYSNDNPTDWTGRSEVTVTLTEKGFVPQKIYITRGTTVTFKTELSSPFWPASDLHPYHTIFPSFDPKAPIEPSESWRYIFEKDGHWDYHDHIGLMTGAIIVVPPGERGSPLYDRIISCDQEDIESRRACWKQSILLTLENEGLTQAFEKMKTLYLEDQDFALRCHDYGHDLGLVAFAKYGDTLPDTGPQTPCTGFYHGYMEGYLLKHEGDATKGEQFCYRNKNGANFDESCLHGIGHGLGEYLLVTRPDLIQNMAGIATLGIKACGYLQHSGYEGKFRCAKGVYAVMRDWVNIQGRPEIYRTYFSSEDPFLLCTLPSESWARSGCAWELSKHILIVLQPNVAKTFAVAQRESEAFDDDLHAPIIFTSIAFLLGERNVFRSDELLVSWCNAIDNETHRMYCIEGMEMGLVFNAEPGNEIPRSARFCSNGALSEEDKSACGNALVRAIEHRYKIPNKSELCEKVSALVPAQLSYCSL